MIGAFVAPGIGAGAVLLLRNNGGVDGGGTIPVAYFLSGLLGLFIGIFLVIVWEWYKEKKNK
jgi:hypothetical protein